MTMTCTGMRLSPSCLLKVHLLDYNEDIGVLDKTVFMHPAGEIWWALNRA